MREQTTTQIRETATSEGVSPLLLSRYSRLAKIDFEDLSRLAAASEYQFVPCDNAIYRQGEAAHHVYVVLDGAVRLERRGPEQTIVDTHHAVLYATFGDSVLRGEADRLNSATADAHTTLVRMPLSLLQEILQSYPDLAGDWAFDIYSRLARRARHSFPAESVVHRGRPSFPAEAAARAARVFDTFSVA